MAQCHECWPPNNVARMWFESVVSFRPCSKVFFLGPPIFSSLLKN